MNLKEIKNELQKLSQMVGDWSEHRTIAPLERDLALEKLRAVYESLRFGIDPPIEPAPKVLVAPSAPPRSESAAAPLFRRPDSVVEEETEFEMVDLSEVLSLDEMPESGPVPAAPAATPHSAPRPAEVREAGSVGVSEPAEALSDDEDDAFDGPEIIEFEPDPEPEATPVRTAPEPRMTAAEPISSAPQSPQPPQPQFAGGGVSAPAAKRSASVGSAAAAKQPAEVPAESGSGEAPSLFGPDEEAMRHRHKQRVIMSLYDTAPETPLRRSAGSAAASESAASAAERPAPAPAEAPFAEPRSESRGTKTAVPDFEEVAPDARIGKFAASRPAGKVAREAEQPGGALHAEAARPAAPQAAESPEAHVLGEVMGRDVQTLGDAIARPRKKLGTPVSDLRQAIGINDKFLMIRDLFGGDGALFDATISALNAQESLDDCMIYIAENFAWNPESDSAKLVMELLERKFA